MYIVLRFCIPVEQDSRSTIYCKKFKGNRHNTEAIRTEVYQYEGEQSLYS